MGSSDDYRYMARALRLARLGLYTTDPNPRVGCVIVRDGAVVGEGWHERAGGPHAEIHALRAAGEAARGATAYVTLEPCCHHGRTPPCSEALIEAGVARVVAAMEDPNPRVAGEGLAQLRAAGIEAEAGVLAAEAEALNPGFVSRMRRGRPFVRCKLAMSLDGRTAMASGESQWITGDAARADVHRLRARSSAILTGIGTVLADDPSLNARLEEGVGVKQPLRVVLDAHLAMPPTARMLSLPGETLVLTRAREPAFREALEAAGAEVMRLPGSADALDLNAVMDCLAEREVNELLVETGAVLAGTLLRAGLIDELVVYLAPHIMGDAARGLFHLPGLEAMQDRIGLEIRDVRAVGRDWRITAVPERVG
ncbi:bifunctional diaminohydroxyphosphoribosylaminopyrimidine deaminase/5-amino-6-(5-phosphoribosylamino)uracil reductase RibD [Thiohalobacter sp. IOR34]|uniref:bifunctional diaminohydroxyphosphoribosylaminopyrimidine deaminase/5-amino-6-(5-phosphoribosylamino)uracil reductase RibD n=1 Tax=Thiohalobacter sp. IOR34 TaxID=3057176 RepID=UPI0025B24901|nr:bifunctional diaminohydroxyphosphoribosylaminopyrimidine deaminase/5-amino-6-(5-phosphoribosylamino)uracil reductase RibD [Thiohalobacter sp. IOR34]WJW76218.1 bifunctional diaminohydroxyphosphoribosylaminopyrimidine deaminase/5-amino-6-(5-phosphoribosylamino)uracil reductase RibD [Thiohalobacter sp. IOR34]